MVRNEKILNGFGEIEELQWEDLGGDDFYIHAFDCPGFCDYACGGTLLLHLDADRTRS